MVRGSEGGSHPSSNLILTSSNATVPSMPNKKHQNTIKIQKSHRYFTSRYRFLDAPTSCEVCHL